MKKVAKVSRTTATLVPRIVRTLLTSGYTIEACDRPVPGSFLLHVRKRETFGGEARCVLLFTHTAARALVLRLTNDAARYNAAAAVVGLAGTLRLPSSVRQFSTTEFFELLGGEIRTDRVFDPKLRNILQALGHGKVTSPLKGKADTLLEEYCQDCFSYLLESPARRYGQDRAFEKLPDALVLAKHRFNVCLDAKAYSGGYHPTASDMRAFGDYVRDFNHRYSSFVGAISVLVVVSGSFPKSESAIRSRTDEFMSDVSTPMIFMRSTDLADAINLLRPLGHLRAALNWRHILIPPVFQIKRLSAELKRVKRDAVV